MAQPKTSTARDLLSVTSLVMRSFAANMRQGEERLEPAHVGILYRLKMESCSLTDLAQHQSVRLPTMSKSVGLLVKRGWVERYTPEDNRRQTIVRLTSDGEQKLAEMMRQAERHVAGILEPLTEKDRARVDAGLQTLIRVMASASPETGNVRKR